MTAALEMLGTTFCCNQAVFFILLYTISKNISKSIEFSFFYQNFWFSCMYHSTDVRCMQLFCRCNWSNLAHSPRRYLHNRAREEHEFSRVTPGCWETIAEFEYQFAPARDNCVMIKRLATFRSQWAIESGCCCWKRSCTWLNSHLIAFRRSICMSVCVPKGWMNSCDVRGIVSSPLGPDPGKCSLGDAMAIELPFNRIICLSNGCASSLCVRVLKWLNANVYAYFLAIPIWWV